MGELCYDLVKLYALYVFIVFLVDVIRGFSYWDHSRGLICPVRLPFLENTFQIIWNYQNIYDYLVEQTLYFKEKTWVLKNKFDDLFYVICSPKNVEHVLKENFDNYVKGDNFRTRLEPFLGNGIFTADGSNWLKQRKTASNIFSVGNFREFFIEVFKEESKKVLQILENFAEREEPIDVHDIFHRFTLESFAKIAFGQNLGILDEFLNGNKTPVEFANAFDQISYIVTKRFYQPFWGITELIDGSRWKIYTYQKIIKSYAMKVITERRMDPDREQYCDLLSRFMNTKLEDGSYYSDEELIFIVLNLLIAGRDTTAELLSWTFYELNDEVVIKIREEMMQVIGYFDSFSSMNPSYEEVKDLKYTKAVLSETLRLHPSVPCQQKTAVNDDVLPDGTFVKKGSVVVYSSYLLGRLSSLWGDDALQFVPERFSKENKDNYTFLAFNAGPRLCLGMAMAYLEASTILTMILNEFDFKLAIPKNEVHYNNALTLSMKSGLPMLFFKRNSRTVGK